MNKKPVMLIVLDGFGIGLDYAGNAITNAHLPNFDKMMKENPTTTLSASGLSVGLPDGQMGNSEVGHLNIGAGRIIYQELTKITKEIEEGMFFENKELIRAMDYAKEHNSKLHLIGLLSEGGVHSHNTHLYALLRLAKMKGLQKVFVHVILDGRDVAPTSGKRDVIALEEKMKEIGVGEIATVSGRYYTMDRDKRWDRTELAYNALVSGIGEYSEDPVAVVEDSYQAGVTDEFVLPYVIKKYGEPIATIDNEDSIIFYNFRPDRARQLTRAIVDKSFESFHRMKEADTYYVCMTDYDKTIPNVHIAYKNEPLVNTIGEYVASKGLKQFRIAETEKYAHVTFFFNGGREEPFLNEDRVLVPSPKVATYDLQPEMSAYQVTDEVIKRIEMKEYDLIILNFANPDMVGHTGVVPAAIKAVETVDLCLGRILKALAKVGGAALVTSDHGNAELMIDTQTGGPVTSHTTNLVPLAIVGAGPLKLRAGILADVSPTLLALMGLEKPTQMSGNSLIEN